MNEITYPAAEIDPPVSTATERTRDIEPPFDRFGRVVFVSGSQVVALISQTDQANETALRSSLQIGSLIKMDPPHTSVFGVVSGLSIPVPAEDGDQSDIMTAEIELLGEVPRTEAANGARVFKRGVSSLPQLNDSVFTATKEDLLQVYARPQVATALIGSVHQDREIPAYVMTNDLLGKHFAILGTTGCGKSCATSLILHAIIDQNPNSHIVLLDPHNEYSASFGEAAEVLSPANLELPYWMLDFEETLQIFFGGAQHMNAAEVSILSEVIPAAKRQFQSDATTLSRITVDTPVPYRLNDVVQILDEAMGRLEKTDGVTPYQRIKAKIKALQTDSRYAFMFAGLGVRDTMERILSRILRIPVDGKPITIIDLSGVPSEIINVVVSVLCRITFDFALWGDRQLPVLLVCEEAHRYASNNEAEGFEPTRRALARIAKEGRKYGVSLCLVSQRPSELASGILSQCNTIFAMRMTNHPDQEILRGTLSDSSLGLLEALPSLGNAEAIGVGEGVSVPLRLCFLDLAPDLRPRSATADFSASWQQDVSDEAFVKLVVSRWRNQQH